MEEQIRDAGEAWFLKMWYVKPMKLVKASPHENRFRTGD